MLKDIIRFEWRYHTRQISFLAAALLYFLFGFGLTSSGFGPDNVHIDSPYSITQSMGMLTLLSVFVLAVFCANAVVRDREHQMEEIVFTTSVEKLHFLAGRFTGSFLAAFTAFSTSALGMLAARFMPWHEADRLGAVNLAHYVWALVVIALPNILFAAVLLFAVSTVTRSVLAAYAASVFLYVLYFVGAALTNSPMMASSVPGVRDDASVAALLDPFALSAFFEQTQYWTPAERNAQLVSLSGSFLLNRLGWIAVSLAGLAVVYRLFSFRVIRRAEVRRSASTASASFPVEPWASAHRRSPILSTTVLEIRSFLFTLPFLALTLLWVGLIAFEIVSDITGGEYGTKLYPAPGLLFGTISAPLTIIGLIVVVYYSAEIVWRERTLRFSEILNSTPASNLTFVTSKWLALATLIATLTAAGFLTGALIQIARGYPVQPGVLLAFAYFSAAPLVLFAAAAILIQTLSPHKYVGMLLVLMFVLVSRAGPSIGLDHPLLRFASTPAVSYSDMSGFEPHAGFHWFVLLWGTLGVSFLLFAAKRWRRDPDGGLKPAAPLVIALGVGAFIFYNTNILNRYESGEDLQRWKADYEKTYKPLAAVPQPRIAEIVANVDLHPEERSYRIRGRYVLVNRTAQPVTKIIVPVRRDADAARFVVPSARVTRDIRFNQYIFELDEPLPPRGRATLHFDLTYASRGFTGGEPGRTLVANGSYVMGFRAFPTIGYRASYEIADPRERRRRGLAAATAEEPPHGEPLTDDWVQIDATVSTSRDQTVVAPGNLVNTWEDGERRFFRFRTSEPVINRFTVASARYAVARETHHGVTIEIAYHPAHEVNVARTMRAAAESLQLFSKSFGPYPHRHLRIAEVPSHWAFGGFADPGMIVLVENRAFLVDGRDSERIDLLYRRVAHEVAHQWWGHRVSAAIAPGGVVLTETLTKYAELLALEKAHGREQVRQLLTYELDGYLSDRTSETGAEPPLLRARDQAYLYYRKGAIVMYALRDLLGEAKLNAALANLVREQSGPGRAPTSAHLLQHILAVAPAQHHPLIHRWMNEVVLYDLRVQSASSRALGDGRHEVTMRIQASPLPAPESIDVGVYSGDGRALHFAKHVLREGTNDIKLIVVGAPESVAVDPYVLRIDRNRFDNVRSCGER